MSLYHKAAEALQNASKLNVLIARTFNRNYGKHNSEEYKRVNEKMGVFVTCHKPAVHF